MWRWGILATGNICAEMARALNGVPEASITAVGSRTAVAARRFARRWGVGEACGSYDEVIRHPEVDIIYVGTPHHLHCELTVAALRAGKHVLCEKPLTMTAAEAERCIEAARANDRFLMEAMWMRFIPAMEQVRRWVAESIGRVRLIVADFCIDVPYDPAHRLFDPRLGGSALLDLGIYPLSFATMLLGWPSRVVSAATLAESGVDELNTLLCSWDGGAQAALTSGSRFYKPASAEVIGSEGRIAVRAPFHHPQSVKLWTAGANGREKAGAWQRIPYQGNGYAHEVLEVHRCLAEGLRESPTVPWRESLRTMRLFDRLLAEWGVRGARGG